MVVILILTAVRTWYLTTKHLIICYLVDQPILSLIWHKKVKIPAILKHSNNLLLQINTVQRYMVTVQNSNFFQSISIRKLYFQNSKYVFSQLWLFPALLSLTTTRHPLWLCCRSPLWMIILKIISCSWLGVAESTCGCCHPQNRFCALA